MRQAVLGAEFQAFPADIYVSYQELTDKVFSARLTITPFGEDAVLQGGRIRVSLERHCLADISFRRCVGWKIPKGQDYGFPIRVQLPHALNGAQGSPSVAGYLLYSNPRSRAHFRCALTPKGDVRIQRVSGARIKLLQWLSAWRDFFSAPLD